MPTVLHISDLHRTAGPHLSNDELLPALVSDAKRWDAERIPRPELIVVSGDLVQGAALNACDPDAEVDAQYREVDDFLRRLGEEFLESDRSRIVIVPGNHDVHWRRSLDGMKPINPCPDGIASKLLEPTSGLRWNWGNRQAHEISDRDLYASRFEHFRRFRKNFYKGIEPNPIPTVRSWSALARRTEAGARLWPQPLGLVLLGGVREWVERIGRKYER